MILHDGRIQKIIAHDNITITTKIQYGDLTMQGPVATALPLILRYRL